VELPDVRTTNYSVNLVLLLTVIRGTFFIVLFVCACVGGGGYLSVNQMGDGLFG
jgi:hypothetical protein